MNPNCLNLLSFGSFAGAGAHHQGLRRLKSCQFQRTVYWHCECDKLCSNARFELLAVCCSWTRGRKANGPCLTRLQSAFVEVSSKVESAWTTVGARFKPGQRRGQKKSKLFGGLRGNYCTILELFGYSRAIFILLLCWRNALSYHLFFFLVLMHGKHFCTRISGKDGKT